MPKLVYMNINALMSLPEREYLSGMGEIIKHGLIKDSEYFYWLLENKAGILSRDFKTLKEMLFVSCNIKRRVVEEDPKEQGDRALLNFGHTIGHAVEKIKEFSMLHGECVALGISAAANMTMQLGNLTTEEYETILNSLKEFKLPIFIADIDPFAVVDATLNDKKMDAGVIKFILLKKIGEAYICKELTKEDLLSGTKSIIKS